MDSAIAKKLILFLPSRLELSIPPTTSLPRGNIPRTSVLDMKLNNEQSDDKASVILEVWGVPLHCHHTPVHSGSEW